MSNDTTLNKEELLDKSIKRALGGGFSGTVAMATQVGTLMWLRTTVNYQYKHGTGFKETLSTLYNQGGIRRFYRGVGPALIQAPLSRFGDTAANTGIMFYLNSNESTKNMPLAMKTFCGSFVAGIWRINLMPIDTCKSMLQVQGDSGMKILREKIKQNGIRTMYYGSMGAFGSTLVGHFPWFFTYNYLNEHIPKPSSDETIHKLARYAVIGFSSSLVSDTVSNSARVVKISRQTAKEKISYKEVFKRIIEEDGILGLMGRGLKTKIISNGVQGLLFTVIWKSLEERF